MKILNVSAGVVQSLVCVLFLCLSACVAPHRPMSVYEFKNSDIANYKTKALAGDPVAARNLAAYYSQVGGDYDESRRWSAIGACSGDLICRHNLGFDIYNGIGGFKDVELGLALISSSAKAGLPSSQLFLQSRVIKPKNSGDQ